MLKIHLSKCFLSPDFHIEITSIVTKIITLIRLYNSVDMMQSMNGVVCRYNLLCLENSMTEKIVI